MAEFFTKNGEDFVPVKEPLHTQEDLDRVVDNRLDRERKKFSDYDELKTKVTTLQNDFDEKLKTFGTEKTDLETKLKKATLETEKVKIINEFNLSDELAEFVNGESPEEMRKGAEKLSQGLKGGSVVINKDKKPDAAPSDAKSIAGKLFGNKSDD